MVKKITLKSKRNKRGKKSKKVGGNNFGSASFNSNFGGTYYDLNTYNNDLFGMTQSSNLHGGKTRKKRVKKI
jgi:hypothetical protein